MNNNLRSARRFGTVLSLAAAVLFGACAQTPPEPDASESGSATSTVGEPPMVATGSPQGEPPTVTEPELVALRPDHPQAYTVVPGDTLWSIAGRFLQNPWQWREIWRQNPQIRNPSKIYPGDVLRFSYDAEGKPQLEVGEREDVPLIKLVPQIRVEELSQPIPPVPRDAVESFLTRALILSDAQWKGMPYIVADDDAQIVYTDRDRVYARGAIFDQPRYQVFRPGEALREPGSDRYLGTAGIYLGQAVVDKDDDPATLTLVNTVAPIRPGDRLIAQEREAELYSFEPHPAPPDTHGFILAKLDTDVSLITQYDSVIINLGEQEGIEPGHVLAIYGKDSVVDDPVSGGTVRLPGERSGLVMVYKVHELVSYALVMQAERIIRLQDQVMTP